MRKASLSIFSNLEFGMRKFITAVVGAAVLASALPASAAPLLKSRPLPSVENAFPNESYAQYRRGYRPHYRDRYYRRDNSGAAVAAGVAGLAAGALIAGAIANQAQAQPAPRPPGTVDPQVAAYCARKYRSYDPASGTFLAHNGMRYVCTYP
jgi:BA14K-like protein